MRYFAFIFFLFCYAGLQGQADMTLLPGFEKQVLGKELEVYNDENGRKSLDEVRHEEYKRSSRVRPNLGFSSGALWVRFGLINKSDRSEYILQINQPLLDTVDVYILNGDEIQHHFRVGEALPVHSHTLSERNFHIPLDLPYGEKIHVYIRIASTTEQIALPVYVMTPDASFRMERTADVLFGGYFGIILIMILYNFFIFISVRDLSYLYYVLYVLFLGFTQATLEGYTQLFFWPENFWFSSRSVYIFTGLVSISSIIFQRNFLRTYRTIPKIDRIGKAIVAYFILIIIASLFVLNPLIHMSSQIGIVLVAIYIFITSILVYRKGYLAARFFIIAWTILVIGIITYALKDAGILPSTPVTNYLLLVGSVLEILLLSLALANRINILKKEKAASQANALRVSIQNENIVREQNLLLERKVSERTADLEKSNEQLSLALTELKSAQTQLVDAEKMATLGQLTAGVAHEINNPINFVLANIEPLKYDIADILYILDRYDEAGDYEAYVAAKAQIQAYSEKIDLPYVRKEIEDLLEGIRDGAHRTAEIVKSLKNFSRLDESNLKFNNINEGLESTLTIIQSNISEKIKIEKDLGDIPLVECLGGKINQVFMNLLNNAVQALQAVEGRDNLLLQLKTWSEEDFVYIRIADNGEGIPEEIKNRIFEPFFTTKDVGEGTGLGLSISYNIIEMHKGSIEVTSEVNKGATFVVKLPVAAKIDFKELG